MFFENNDNMIYKCTKWNELYTKRAAELIEWSWAEDIFINEKGEVVPQHDLDPSFDLNEYVMQLREKKLQWKQIYWKLWATTTVMKWTTWKKYFKSIDYLKWYYSEYKKLK